MGFDNKPARFQLGVNHNSKAVPLVLLTPETLGPYTKQAGRQERHFLSQMPESPNYVEDWVRKDKVRGTFINITSDDDDIANPYNFMYALSDHAKSLRAERFRFADGIKLTELQLYNLTLGWGLGAYSFNKYKTKKSELMATLVIPKKINQKRLMRELNATAWAQDLINEPSSVLHTQALAQEATQLAAHFNARVHEIIGKQLLGQNYPLVYAVGRGAATDRERQPRLVDIRWGDPKNPALTLVGKGVVFDTGGLNAKDDDGMQHMKQDMAGAAHAMSLAYMIMDANLPVHMRLLLPIVENAGGPKAYRQGDIIKNRSGETVEIVNTDAEGRLILSDVLYEASHPTDGKDTPTPDLIMDFATLGWHGYTEFPNYGSAFANKRELQEKFLRATRKNQEYFTGRPLMKRLMRELESHQADIRQCNAEHGDYDDLLAALLLSRNVDPKIDWIHTDLQVWRSATHERTHTPAGLASGGFVQGIRSAFRLIEDRYAAPEI